MGCGNIEIFEIIMETDFLRMGCGNIEIFEIIMETDFLPWEAYINNHIR